MARLLIVAAGALIDGDGRVLIAQRPQGKAHAGFWEFPGGKVDDGETPEQALVRELGEELGIDVQAACLAPFSFASTPLGEGAADGASDDGSQGVHLLMPLFICRKWDGIARPIEAAELAWAKPDALLTYRLAPADRPLAAQLRDYL